MLQRLLYLLLLLVLLGCSSGNPPNVDHQPSEAVSVPIRTATEDGTDQESLVLANSDFAFDLCARLRHRDGNLVFSPYNISNGLAMVYAGARGKTEEELARCLRLPFGQDRTHAAFHELNQLLRQALKEQGVMLNTANRIWADEGLRIEDAFLEITRDRYEAELAAVDFADKRDKACREMNQWVKEQTNGKISEIISPSNLASDTLMVLLCAIYFKANWAMPFSEAEPAPFRVSRRETVKVPMMHNDDVFRAFRMAVTADSQILELRYNVPPKHGGDFSMLVILPKRDDGIMELEANLTTDNLGHWTSGLEEGHFEVYLPRFKVSAEIELNSVLREMGITSAFEATDADFSAIAAEARLYLNKASHAALITVDEKGTEATASTQLALAAFDDSEPNVFRADHPFLFVIRHNPTGTILFLGRVVNPLDN